jgi:phosphatidate cytidylyltransferase
MKRVLTAVILIPLVLLLVLKAPLWFFVVAVSIISLLATHELLTLIEKHGVIPFKTSVYLTLTGLLSLSGVGAIWLPANRGLVIVPVFGALAIFALFPIFLTLAMRTENLRSAYLSASANMGAVAYIFLPTSCLIGLGMLGAPDSWVFLIFLLLSVWAGDVFALYVGRAIGRHKLAPRISPNKTWEGAAASVLGAVLAAWLWVRFAPSLTTILAQVGFLPSSLTTDRVSLDVPPAAVVLLAVATNIAAQLGDLVESMMKRGAEVKDSGTLVPGHGGILDRIDALLFAAPVVWYYAFYLVLQGS